MKDMILLVIGAILGFISQWLLEVTKERRDRRLGPNIVIAKYGQNEKLYAELHNLGPDGLAEMDVAMSWESGGKTQAAILKNFFEPSQNLDEETPGFSDYLAANERLLVADLPFVSDDGLVTIRVTGLGQNSRRLYETRSQIAVRVQPS